MPMFPFEQKTMGRNYKDSNKREIRKIEKPPGNPAALQAENPH